MTFTDDEEFDRVLRRFCIGAAMVCLYILLFHFDQLEP